MKDAASATDSPKKLIAVRFYFASENVKLFLENVEHPFFIWRLKRQYKDSFRGYLCDKL